MTHATGLSCIRSKSPILLSGTQYPCCLSASTISLLSAEVRFAEEGSLPARLGERLLGLLSASEVSVLLGESRPDALLAVFPMVLSLQLGPLRCRAVLVEIYAARLVWRKSATGKDHGTPRQL